ncbi:hypothetical protein [Teichococcus aestuarii]|uniref:hypothetical protein n=1 Tax=Teichococcus aestuarii TaxID=568898 RepID=UPI0011B284E7|nr:hypothetical protein [Pseudoroseomonas aestuarii]
MYAPLPAEIASTFLDAAKPLSFSLVPASAAAEGLVEAIAGQVAEYGAAGRKRQPRKKLGDQHRAVGTITGSLLKRWSAEQPACVWHSAKAEGFTELPVGYRLFKAAQEGMIALGYVSHAPGIRFNASGFDSGPWSGRASRMWPTEKLLALACEHGVTPGHVPDAFRFQMPSG